MKDRSSMARAVRSADRPLRGFLILAAVTSLLFADQALARRGKSGLPPGVQLVPLAQRAADPTPVRPPVGKPLVHARRHGSKPRGVTH